MTNAKTSSAPIAICKKCGTDCETGQCSSAHTPAPWYVYDPEDHQPSDNGGIEIGTAKNGQSNGFVICDVWGTEEAEKHDDEAKSNANLIAAAPKTKEERDELLEACEKLIESCKGNEEVDIPIGLGLAIVGIKEVVSKTKGE